VGVRGDCRSVSHSAMMFKRHDSVGGEIYSPCCSRCGAPGPDALSRPVGGSGAWVTLTTPYTSPGPIALALYSSSEREKRQEKQYRASQAQDGLEEATPGSEIH
jgi:hypothetical protein